MGLSFPQRPEESYSSLRKKKRKSFFLLLCLKVGKRVQTDISDMADLLTCLIQSFILYFIEGASSETTSVYLL